MLEYAVEAHVGRITIRSEAVAIGAAASAGDTDINTIIAICQTGEIVSPCGMCRELISDDTPEARVIVLRAGAPTPVPVLGLLPDKYLRPESS